MAARAAAALSCAGFSTFLAAARLRRADGERYALVATSFKSGICGAANGKTRRNAITAGPCLARWFRRPRSVLAATRHAARGIVGSSVRRAHRQRGSGGGHAAATPAAASKLTSAAAAVLLQAALPPVRGGQTQLRSAWLLPLRQRRSYRAIADLCGGHQTPQRIATRRHQRNRFGAQRAADRALPRITSFIVSFLFASRVFAGRIALSWHSEKSSARPARVDDGTSAANKWFT